MNNDLILIDQSKYDHQSVHSKIMTSPFKEDEPVTSILHHTYSCSLVGNSQPTVQ